MDMLTQGDQAALPSEGARQAEVEHEVRTLVDQTPDLGMSGGTVYLLSDFPADVAFSEIQESCRQTAALG